MINVSKKIDCCGCGGCAQACPVSCIRMVADAEGFLYPKVDATLCISCGSCTSACPMLLQGRKPARETEVYAAQCHDDELRRTSSSGGVFSLLAERILTEGGAVFGAAFAEDWSVHHIMIDSAEDLPLLKGSKYLQSRIENTYHQAETVLRSGRAVLFTGTGCQIAGLKSYLKKDYDRLYTAEVFCHGVPSPEVWKKYLQMQKEAYNSTIGEVYFRYKTFGWHRFSMVLRFARGEVYERSHDEDAFMKVFLNNLCLRPSCHGCKFRESRSGADLTIGDAWGIERTMPDMDDDKGTSVVVVNTERGRLLWNMVSPEMKVRRGAADTLLADNAMYYKPAKPHPNREKFFAALADGASMDELVLLCKKPLWRRVLSLGKRCVKKVMRVCGFRI